MTQNGPSDSRILMQCDRPTPACFRVTHPFINPLSSHDLYGSTWIAKCIKSLSLTLLLHPDAFLARVGTATNQTVAVAPNGFFAVHQNLCVSLLTASLFYRMECCDCCSFVSSNSLRCVNFAHSDLLMDTHVHHLITKCLSL